jgi:hypothetical protein
MSNIWRNTRVDGVSLTRISPYAANLPDSQEPRDHRPTDFWARVYIHYNALSTWIIFRKTFEWRDRILWWIRLLALISKGDIYLTSAEDQKRSSFLASPDPPALKPNFPSRQLEKSRALASFFPNPRRLKAPQNTSRDGRKKILSTATLVKQPDFDSIYNLSDLRVSRRWLRRMTSSGMLCRAALIITDVSEEHSASFIRVTRIGELGTTIAVTSNRSTLRRKIRLTFPVKWFLSHWWWRR